VKWKLPVDVDDDDDNFCDASHSAVIHLMAVAVVSVVIE